MIATAENRENFVRSLLPSMNDDDMVNPVSGLRMKVDIRALEAGLDPKKLLDPRSSSLLKHQIECRLQLMFVN